MDPSTQQLCNEVMKKIRSHPVSEMFLEPVDPIRDLAPDYYKTIKKPMDLSTVQSKLDNGIYKSVQEWKDDMHLITNNATTYNGKKSAVGSVAIELQRIFRELSRSINDGPFLTWYNQLMDLKRDLKSHALLKVARIQGNYDNNIMNPKYQTKDIEKFPEIHRFLIKSMTIEELQKLRSLIHQQKQPEIRFKIIKLIQTANPRMITEKNVNLQLLPPNVLAEIKLICNA